MYITIFSDVASSNGNHDKTSGNTLRVIVLGHRDSKERKNKAFYTPDPESNPFAGRTTPGPRREAPGQINKGRRWDTKSEPEPDLEPHDWQ